MSRKVNITLPNISELKYEVKLNGQWYKLDQLSNNLQSSVKEGYDKGISLIGKRLLSTVKRAMLTGTPPPNSNTIWPPLAPSTLKRHGDHKIYNLKGRYYKSIKVSHYKNKTIVGIPYKTKRSSKGGLTLNQLAILLEYGNVNRGGRIPARPLWGPSLKSIGGSSAISKELIKQIRSSLYRAAGIRANQVR